MSRMSTTVVMAKIARVIAVTLALAVGLAAPGRAEAQSGEVIRNWNTIACAQAFGNPLRLSRILAIVHVAQHDAVNGAEPRYTQYVSTLTDLSADAEAAAAAAAHRVLVLFFPDKQTALDDELVNSLAGIPDGPAKDAGVALGSATGQLVFISRVNDGYTSVDPYNPTPGPGVWEPTRPGFLPLLEPQFQNVTPWVLNSRDQFFVEPPHALTSEDYTREFNEVKAVGGTTSTVRTADQTAYAHFWAEPSPRGWSRVGNIVSTDLDYDLHETALLLAMLNTSMMDGFVAGWYWKRYYSFWRPITAIANADADGNPDTEPDNTTWTSLRITPNLPDHPSTHSILGGVAAEILRQFTGTDYHSFCMTSTTAVPAGAFRCWSSFTEAETENGESRIFAGFHFRKAVKDGIRQGRQIGKFASKHHP
jgi:VCPO second helical-bundle domain